MTDAVTPQDPAPVAPSIPEWLPEKFVVKDENGGLDLQASAQKLALSNRELEAEYTRMRQGDPAPDDPAPADPAPTDPAPTESTGSPIEAASEYFAEHGQLSDEHYEALAKAGLDRTTVDTYIAGHQSSVTQYANQLYEVAGGEQTYDSMMDWAAKTLPESEQNAFDAIVSDGDPAKAKLAVRALYSQYTAAVGRDPSLVQATADPNPTSAHAFRSQAEVRAAMENPRYQTDPAYRDDVYRRLAASPPHLS